MFNLKGGGARVVPDDVFYKPNLFLIWLNFIRQLRRYLQKYMVTDQLPFHLLKRLPLVFTRTFSSHWLAVLKYFLKPCIHVSKFIFLLSVSHSQSCHTNSQKPVNEEI